MAHSVRFQSADHRHALMSDREGRAWVFAGVPPLVPGQPLNAGTLSFLSASASLLSLTATGPSGGAPPYLRKLFLSASPGFLPPGSGTLVETLSASGIVSYSASPASNDVYWYRELVTDSASGSALGNELPACLFNSPLGIGFIGDSITAGTNGDPVGVCIADLAGLYGPRVVTSVNRGVSGTTTADWLPGGSYLAPATAAFAAAGVSVVHIMLGTNDAYQIQASAATFGANMAAVVSALTGAGYRVVLAYPPYFDYHALGQPASDPPLLRSYQAQIDALVNGASVLAGDRSAWRQFAGASLLAPDGLHPSPAGNVVLGQAWAAAVAVALGYVTATLAVAAR